MCSAVAVKVAQGRPGRQTDRRAPDPSESRETHLDLPKIHQLTALTPQLLRLYLAAVEFVGSGALRRPGILSGVSCGLTGFSRRWCTDQLSPLPAILEVVCSSIDDKAKNLKVSSLRRRPAIRQLTRIRWSAWNPRPRRASRVTLSRERNVQKATASAPVVPLHQSTNIRLVVEVTDLGLIGGKELCARGSNSPVRSAGRNWVASPWIEPSTATSRPRCINGHDRFRVTHALAAVSGRSELSKDPCWQSNLGTAPANSARTERSSLNSSDQIVSRLHPKASLLTILRQFDVVPSCLRRTAAGLRSGVLNQGDSAGGAHREPLAGGYVISRHRSTYSSNL